MNSIASNASFRSTGQTCVPNVVVGLLGTELLILVALVVFFDNQGTSGNLFYLGTMGFLMSWTIYFSWHSLVKENVFEMTAFLSMAIIMSFEGIYFVLAHHISTIILCLSIAYFILIFMIYLGCCYYCYMHHCSMAFKELTQSTHLDMLRGVKDYETFISLIKLSFITYTVIGSTCLYYLLDQWDDFRAEGTSIVSVVYFIFIFHSLLGIYSVMKEKNKFMILYMIFVPVLQIFLAFSVYEIYAAPGGDIEFILLQQLYAMLVAGFVISSGSMYLGVKNYKNFGTGINSIIKKTNDDAIKAAFL
jgi:hypothetical protein